MIKKFSFIFSSKILFFLITTAIILSLNLTPLILDIRHAPPGRSFALIHNNAQDFFFYQSLMNEGTNGSLLTSDPFTSEPHQPSFIFSYFLYLGKISKLLGLSHAVTYHLTRIILSLLFLFTVYYFLFSIRIPYPRLAYLFFLFAAPLMNNGTPFMNWWTGMDPIRRVAYLPHHMAGGLLLVITIILLIKHFNINSKFKMQNAKPQFKIQNYKYFIWSIVLIPFLAFVHTPSLFIILLILPASIIGYYCMVFWESKIKFSQKILSANQNYLFIGLFAYLLIGLFFMFLMISQTNKGFPWSQYIAWEKTLQFPLDKELIGAFGIIFPLAVIGMVRLIMTKKFTYILIACWFIVPLLFIPFAKVLNISNVRLIQGVPYLPLAILAVLGMKTILEMLTNNNFLRSQAKFSQIASETLKHFTHKGESHDKRNRLLDSTDLESPHIASKKISADELKNLIVKSIILIIFIIFTLPTLSWSLKDQIREYWPIFGNVYFDNRLFNAFSFINNNFPKKTVTLSTFYTGNYLPAFTHTVSFIGHFSYTYKIEEKQILVRKFFENKMTNQEAKEFILGNKIDLIFQGPEEKPIYSRYLYPSLLKPIYDREEATLYILPRI